MRDDLLATVCRRDVHGPGTHLSATTTKGADGQCPVWCDAGWRSTSQFGSPHDPPTQAPGSTTVPWDHILVTGNTAMIGQPVPMVKAQGGDDAYSVLAQARAGVVPQPPDTRHPEERHPGNPRFRRMDEVVPQAVADRQDAENGIRALLRLMGEDPDREGIQDTPARVVKAYLEMASRPGDPAELLSRVFGDVGQSSEMICVPGIRFVSLCEHHLLPFTGTAAVAYIPQPGGSVVGLSKIPRLVHHFAMRPQVQERLTRQIADALETGLTADMKQPLGVAVRIDSTHSCMSLRGVKADAASMVTSDLRGRFLEGPARAEFLSEAQR